MRILRSLLAHFRGPSRGVRVSYIDRSIDSDARRAVRRTGTVTKPLPFQEDFLGLDSGSRYTPRVKQQPFDYENVGNESSEETKAKAERGLIPYDVTPENRFELINRVMCPLHVVTYENQLKTKYAGMKKILSEFGRKIKFSGKSSLIVDSQNLPCPVDFVKPSPRIAGYRNKDEFSIWPGVDGNPKTVGFFIGQPSHHTNVVCVEPDHLIIMKDSHKKIASSFQQYLREVSGLDVCLNFSEGGNWRRFVVRSNEAGDHMIIGQLHPQNLTDEEINEEKDKMRRYFEERSHELGIKSAYLQALRTSRSPHSESPYQHLFGDQVLYETLLGKMFTISPESFFQTNVLAAEVLYTTVMDELELAKDMTVIDLCCGTGSLAILMAPHVRRVIGIEMSEQAVADANRNAELNGVKNVSFINGAAEDVMPSLGEQFFRQRIVVVANPGRAGLRSSVIAAIREIEQITKLVYIACKPQGDAMKNFFHLSVAQTPNCPGSALLPINAIPVDMFPQTDHVELVLTFERFL